MTKKTRLIPFNYDRYKAGAKVVFAHLPALVNETIVNIYDNSRIRKYLVVHTFDGTIDHLCVSDEHLMLEEELEEKTFFLPIIDDMSVVLHRYESIEVLKKNVSAWYGTQYKGALKITYTDEDLIK